MTIMKIPLTPEATDALREQGMATPPKYLEIELREASMRERARFESDVASIGDMSNEQGQEWLTDLLMRRLADPETPRMVVREVVRDMAPSDLARHVSGYVQGALPDPKVMARAVKTTLTGLTDRLLGVMADGS